MRFDHMFQLVVVMRKFGFKHGFKHIFAGNKVIFIVMSDIEDVSVTEEVSDIIQRFIWKNIVMFSTFSLPPIVNKT